jgi:hypothetical protein
MEPEDDNIGVIRRVVDNDFITRNYGDYMVSGGGISYNPYGDVDIPNGKGEMFFPELLFKIIKKNLPDIYSIEIDSYRNNLVYNPINFEPVPSYLVKLIIKFHWDAKDISTPEKLTESINTAFSMMHTDIDFIKFQVKRISIEKRDYESEFFSMFMKK